MDFMVAIQNDAIPSVADILFAPHHERKSGRSPKAWLDAIDPAVIIVENAQSDELKYYRGYNTQSSEGDVLFGCGGGKVDAFVSSSTYTVGFLSLENHDQYGRMRYVGTFSTEEG